jgi:hypothetical protein
MKVRVGDVRRVIREEYLRGVPTFVLRQATERYVDEIRQHIKRFILMNKSVTDIDSRSAIAAANEVLDELEEKANDLLEDQIWSFIQKV